MTGVIKAIIRRREGQNGGYFFILDEAKGERFAHASNLRGTSFEDLREGKAVEFEPIMLEGRGLRAENVKIL